MAPINLVCSPVQLISPVLYSRGALVLKVCPLLFPSCWHISRHTMNTHTHRVPSSCPPPHLLTCCCALCLRVCAVQSATEAACLILSVDETVKNPRSEAPDAAAMGAGRGGGRGMRGGRGRGMRR
jgi:hypothetical protein